MSAFASPAPGPIVTPMSGYLYLLVDKAKPTFKIAIAVDVGARAAKFRATLDAARSTQFRFDTPKEARGAERTLHHLFRAYRYARPKEAAGGHTEWFQMRAFRSVETFLKDNRALLAWRDCGQANLNNALVDRTGGMTTDAATRRRMERHRLAIHAEPQKAPQFALDDLRDEINTRSAL